MKTVDIKGKPYVCVNERVKAFIDNYPEGSINTEIYQLEGTKVVMVATVTPDLNIPDRFFTGWSYEDETNGFINKTSYIENCETSAVGRALGFMGIGIDASMATADEVANAMLNQKKKPTSGIEKWASRVKEVCPTVIWSDMMEQYKVKKLSELSEAQQNEILKGLINDSGNNN